MIGITGHAQNLDDRSRTEITLSDGTTLVLYKSHSFERNSKHFYYLPVNMHVAHKDSRPEISLLQYDTEDNRGAILHFLLTWGLSLSQEKEANDLLNMRLKDTVYVAGPVLVDAAPASFIITGKDRLVEIMNAADTQSSRAPIVPGSKLAASFRFRASDLEYLCKMIREPCEKTDGKLQMIFTFKTMVREGYISKPVEHEWILEMALDHLFQYLRD